MSKMVSARIPDALFDQGSAQLEDLGVTPSELIKAAYEYVVKERALPQQVRPISQKRKLSKQQLQALRAKLSACSLDLDIPADVSYDKSLIREAKAAHYEALA